MSFVTTLSNLPNVCLGHVGAPLPCNLIKLVDVAEKNYFASKGEGEVSRERFGGVIHIVKHKLFIYI